MLETTTILDAEVAFHERPFVAPLILSSGAIHSITEATATVTVDVAGRRATGRGSIYLSDLWAWPDPTRTHDERDAVLRDLCKAFAADLPALCGAKPAHPLELGLRLLRRPGGAPLRRRPFRHPRLAGDPRLDQAPEATTAGLVCGGQERRP